MRRLPLDSLRQRYVVRERPLPVSLRAELLVDPRRGVRAILEAVDRRLREHRSEGQRLRVMLRYETELWAAGVTRVAGVDEAGMSPLAGPVAAAAVILAPGTRIPEVDDSKKLEAACRERLAPIIQRKAVAWCVAFAESDEIDELNIYWAGMLAMRRAIEGLCPPPQHLLVDARQLDGIRFPQQGIVHGDAKSLSIAAASILAKTARDARMVELDRQYPGYGFAQHKGYPVRAHCAALRSLGPCPVHRRSFERVRQLVEPARG